MTRAALVPIPLGVVAEFNPSRQARLTRARHDAAIDVCRCMHSERCKHVKRDLFIEFLAFGISAASHFNRRGYIAVLKVTLFLDHRCWTEDTVFQLCTARQS